MIEDVLEFQGIMGGRFGDLSFSPRYINVVGDSSATMGSFLELSASQGAWVIEAARKLEALGRLPSNWDSYGGLSLDPASKELTLRVLGWLGFDDLPIPQVALGSGGEVHLEWRKKGRELEVELGNSKGHRIEFMKVYPTGRIEEGFEDDAVSQKLVQLSDWLLRG